MAKPRVTLCPGFKQVTAFGANQEYEVLEDGSVEEEVEYVTVDLGQVEPTLVPSSSEYRLVGLDTPTPFLQLSGTIFKGKHQTLLGTELLFAEPKDDHQSCGARKPRPPLVHVGTTEQRIKFKDVELKPAVQETVQNQAQITPDSTQTIGGNVTAGSSGSFSYEQLVGNPNPTTTAGRGRGRGGKGRKPRAPEVSNLNQALGEGPSMTVQNGTITATFNNTVQASSNVDRPTPMDIDSN